MAENPYQALGLEPRFHLNSGEVRQAYLRRIATLHPDHAALNDPHGEDGGSASAGLNRARRELEDPERRANALLALLGGPAKEADKSLPDGFLMQIMEIREDIEGAATPGEKDRWRKWAADQRADYSRRVGGMFEAVAAKGEGERAGGLAEIRRQLNAWRYIERLIEQLDPRYNPAEDDFRD